MTPARDLTPKTRTFTRDTRLGLGTLADYKNAWYRRVCAEGERLKVAFANGPFTDAGPNRV